jgi:hypothetical protein
MLPSDKRQTFTLLAGGVAAILAAFLGLLVSDIPVRLRSFISSPMAWVVVLTCTLPIVIILAANQISLLLKTSTDREDTIRDISRLLPCSSLIIHFETSADAMEYLIEGIPRAQHVFNTRLSTQVIESSDPLNVRLTKKFDDQVWAAIQSGTNYDLIVSKDHQSHASHLLDTRRSFSKSHKGVGTCSCWILGDSEVPLFHFCILEYTEHRELLIGWALTSSRSFGDKVFLIRDERLVNYFRGLFETYVAVARPVN